MERSALSRLEYSDCQVTEGNERLIRLTYLLEQDDEYTSQWHQLRQLNRYDSLLIPRPQGVM